MRPFYVIWKVLMIPINPLGEVIRWYQRSGLNRHSLREPDFESGASANSATLADQGNQITRASWGSQVVLQLGL